MMGERFYFLRRVALFLYCFFFHKLFKIFLAPKPPAAPAAPKPVAFPTANNPGTKAASGAMPPPCRRLLLTFGIMKMIILVAFFFFL